MQHLRLYLSSRRTQILVTLALLLIIPVLFYSLFSVSVRYYGAYAAAFLGVSLALAAFVFTPVFRRFYRLPGLLTILFLFVLCLQALDLGFLFSTPFLSSFATVVSVVVYTLVFAALLSILGLRLNLAERIQAEAGQPPKAYLVYILWALLLLSLFASLLEVFAHLVGSLIFF